MILPMLQQGVITGYLMLLEEKVGFISGRNLRKWVYIVVIKM
jgi:hypothetical protein